MFGFGIVLIIIIGIATIFVGVAGFLEKAPCVIPIVLTGLLLVTICGRLTWNSYERTGTVVGKEIDKNSCYLIIEYKNDFMKIEVDDTQYKYKNKGDTLKFSFDDKYKED